MPQSNRLPEGAQFDESRADRAVRFIEGVCVHTKSQWARQPFILTDWQREIIRAVFGAIKYDEQWGSWIRQYNLVWLEVARKNGKSELLAAIALYLLIADGQYKGGAWVPEESGEIYGAAGTREQAGHVFEVAQRMCELSPWLSKRVQDKRLVIVKSQKRLVWTPTNSFYKVVSADATTNLGGNPTGVVFDEVLAQPNRDLWDSFITAAGTREQMLMVSATTAGNDRTSFAYQEHEFGLRVAEDPEQAPNRYVYIRYIPEDADWRDEDNWSLANPALGSFLNINTLRESYKEALNNGDLAAQSAWRQFRANQWQRQSNRWIDMQVWDESHTTVGAFDESSCEGLDGWAGLDLAETEDFNAFVMLFKDGDQIKLVPRFWIPRGTIDRRHKNIKSFIESWERRGFLRVIDGDVANQDVITADIMADLERFNIRELAYDPWSATAVVQRIENDTNTVCVKVPQSATRLNEPSKELMRRVGDRSLGHNANPILRWMADNVEAQIDSDGNIKPSKKRSPEKIDGIVALVNGMSAMIRESGATQEYGMFVLED